MDHKKQFKPGFYYGISNEDYHASVGISKSGIDLIAKSPRHYQAAYLEGRPRPKTAAMIKGERIHCAILEPEIFSSTYKVLPNDLSKLNKNSNAYKDGLSLFKELNPKCQIIDQEEFTELVEIQKSVFNHKVRIAGKLYTGKELLSDGQSELSGFCVDPETGVTCKVRPDFFKNNGTIVDIKSTEDASDFGFERSVTKYRYHVQAAWYLDHMSLLSKRDLQQFVIIAVEKTYPYAVQVFHFPQAVVEKGRELYKRDLQRYAECLEKNEWPCYGEEIVDVGLPHWAW